MNLGELRNKIEIQQYTHKENEIGESTKVWTTYKKAWASIKPLNNGKQESKAGKDQFSIVYKIKLRYMSDITRVMRIVYHNKIFRIDHVINYEELNKETHLLCTVIEEGVYNV